MQKQNKNTKNEVFKIIQKYKNGISWSTIKAELTGKAPQEKRDIKILERKRDRKTKTLDQIRIKQQQLAKVTNYHLSNSKRIVEKRYKQKQKIAQLNQEIMEINQKIEMLQKRVAELKVNPFCETLPLSTLRKYLNELTSEGLIVRILIKSNGRTYARYALSSPELNKLYYEDKQREKNLKYELEEKESEYNAPDNSYHKQLAQAMRKVHEEMFGEKQNAPTKEEIEKLKQEQRKSQNNYSFDLTGYGGVKGIHNIKDREKAKKLFDRYLHILTRQLGYFILLDIRGIAFSLESKGIIERLKNGDYWFDVRQDIAENFVSKLQKDFVAPMSFLSNCVMELLVNADVAFGNGVGDPNSSVNQFLEWYCENEELHIA